jgi:hypothetical protein
VSGRSSMDRASFAALTEAPANHTSRSPRYA